MSETAHSSGPRPALMIGRHLALTWGTFWRGWGSRVAKVKQIGQAWVGSVGLQPAFYGNAKVTTGQASRSPPKGIADSTDAGATGGLRGHCEARTKDGPSEASAGSFRSKWPASRDTLWLQSAASRLASPGSAWGPPRRSSHLQLNPTSLGVVPVASGAFHGHDRHSAGAGCARLFACCRWQVR